MKGTVGLSRRSLVAYLFLLPSLTGLIVFRIFPIIYTFIGSLFNVDYYKGGTSFVGFENYLNVLKDPIFWHSLKVTLIFNLVVNPVQITIALILAVLLNGSNRSIRIIRTLFLLPLGVSVTIASTIWNILLNPNEGLINSFLNFFGIPSQPFLTSPSQALWCIVLVASWCGIPYWMMFLLAGLQDIPVEYYEAAKIDGATNWQSFWYITLPLLKRALTFVVVADTTANFLLFAPVFILTRGGPQWSTNLLMYETYSNAFVYSDYPRALTLTSILLLMTLVIVLLELRVLQKEES
ncbi:MAG TPA: sugar ABC transporter permease [Thermotogaceae bacterium]|nr:sugar ABC transporter permease [Thermotogaceae bacterium]